MSISQEGCLPFGPSTPSARLLLALYLEAQWSSSLLLHSPYNNYQPPPPPPESLPTSNSENLTQLKKSQPIQRIEIDITSKIPVVVTVVIV